MEARLTAVVSTRGAAKADKELNNIARSSKKVESNVIRAESRFKSFGKNAAASIATIDGPLGGLSSRVSSLVTVLTSGTAAITLFAAALAATGFILVQGISNLDEYDVNLRRVNATIKATGEGVGFTGIQLREEAENLALATLTSVDAVQKAQAKLLTFNRVLGNEFTRSIRLSQDLAEAGFGSIESNAILLGKALQDPIKGMSALSRVGVTLSENQKKLARDAVATGDVFSAQAVILSAVEGQVKGVAASVADDTLAGNIDTLGQRWDDLTRKVAESSGALTLWSRLVKGAAITAEQITDALAGPTSDELFNKSLALFEQLSEAESKLQAAMDSSRSGYGHLQVAVVKLKKEHDAALVLAQEAAEADNKLVRARGAAALKEAEARKRINAEVLAEAKAKAEAEKVKADEKIARITANAQKELDVLNNLNNSQLESINAKEQMRLTNLESIRGLELDGLVGFESAKTEITAAAERDRANLERKTLKTAEGVAAKKAAIEEGVRQDRLGVLDNTESDLRNSLGEENALFKAAAITNATIKTYESANSAFSAMASIPIVGPALGAAAAAVAIGAGLTNVSKIASAREQGGQFSAGDNLLVGERGPEMIQMKSSGRVRTANQIKNDSSGSQPQVSLVVIDQSSGEKEFTQETQDDGRIVLLIRSTVAGDLTNSNSDISKSLSNSTTTERRR